MLEYKAVNISIRMKKTFTTMAYVTINPSFFSGSLPTSNLVNFRKIRQKSINSDGPTAKAEAKNRGARMAVIQNGRAARPEYRKAVTV